MMDKQYYPVSTEDVQKMMSLVQEYSEKLRIMCENYIERKAKTQQSLLMMFAFFGAIALSSLSFISIPFISDQNKDNIMPILSSFVLAATIATSIMIMATRKVRDYYDIHQVAMTVERLIRTASQYGEHSIQNLSDKFEFDIRLAEAEAALRVYKNIFHQKKSPLEKLF